LFLFFQKQKYNLILHNKANDHSPLQRKTTSMDAKHYGGFLEYDVHQLYGILETMATTKGLEELTNKRAFVLSRSTFPGSGKYGGHWTGDNYSTWAHLYYSIGSMLNFQMFGIPYAVFFIHLFSLLFFLIFLFLFSDD